jgi:hypothetical protein
MDLIGHEKERLLLQDLRHHMKQWQLTVPPHRTSAASRFPKAVLLKHPASVRLPHPDEFVPSVFLDQAVALRATYYNIMILIHRPFITIKSSPLTGTSRVQSHDRELIETLIVKQQLNACRSVARRLERVPKLSKDTCDSVIVKCCRAYCRRGFQARWSSWLIFSRRKKRRSMRAVVLVEAGKGGLRPMTPTRRGKRSRT